MPVLPSPLERLAQAGYVFRITPSKETVKKQSGLFLKFAYREEHKHWIIGSEGGLLEWEYNRCSPWVIEKEEIPQFKAASGYIDNCVD